MTTRLAQPAPRRRLLSFGPHRWLPRPGGLVGRTGPRPKHYRPPACSTVRNRLRSEPHIWRPILHGRKGRHWVESTGSPSPATFFHRRPGNPTRSDRNRASTPQAHACADKSHKRALRSEEHTSELQSLMRISYAVFSLKNKKKTTK